MIWWIIFFDFNKLFNSFQSFFGFGQTADIAIELDGSDKRKQVEVKNEDGKREKLFLYYDGETIAGKVKNFDYLLYK